MLRDNLKIDLVIKFDVFEYIILDFNDIVILRFDLIRATQQFFFFFFLYFKYRKYCLKYIANSYTLFFN